MLTIFATPKPFVGHTAIIQRNALRSWTFLHPDVEVILFGDDEGATEVCAELGLHHEPYVQRNESGLKRIDYYFDRAQEIARHNTLCYVNCDIVLLPDFRLAVEQVRAAHQHFLMVGRRWDMDFADPIDFSNPNWTNEIRSRALKANHRRDSWFIDYFAFSRGLYHKRVPPFVIGRVVWDNWLIWHALDLGIPVVDASSVVWAVHQNHDYNYHPLGKAGVWNDQLAQRNFTYAGGRDHMRTIAHATEIVSPNGLRPNPTRHARILTDHLSMAWRILRFDVWHPVWFSFLDATRPLRRALGLRSKHIRASEKL